MKTVQYPYVTGVPGYRGCQAFSVGRKTQPYLAQPVRIDEPLFGNVENRLKRAFPPCELSQLTLPAGISDGIDIARVPRPGRDRLILFA